MGNVSRTPAPAHYHARRAGLWAGEPTVVGDGWLGSLSSGCPPHSAGPPQAPPFPQGPHRETETGLCPGGPGETGVASQEMGDRSFLQVVGALPPAAASSPTTHTGSGSPGPLPLGEEWEGRCHPFSLWGPAQLPSSLNPPEQGGARYRSFPGTPGPAAGGGRGSGLESQPRKLMKDAP